MLEQSYKIEFFNIRINMLIIDGGRHNRVLVVLNHMISRIGLYILSYYGGEIAIDTPYIAIRICNTVSEYHCIHYAQKLDNHTFNDFISQPLFKFLNESHTGYWHIMFKKLIVDDYIPHMLFVGVAGYELLPPMIYSLDSKIKSLDICMVDYAGGLPIRLIRL